MFFKKDIIRAQSYNNYFYFIMELMKYTCILDESKEEII